MRNRTTVYITIGALAALAVILAIRFHSSPVIAETPVPPSQRADATPTPPPLAAWPKPAPPAENTPAPVVPATNTPAPATVPRIVQTFPDGGTLTTHPPRPWHVENPRPGDRCYFWDEKAGVIIEGKVGEHWQFVADEPRVTHPYTANGGAINLHYPLYEEATRYPSSPLHYPPVSWTPPPANWKGVYTDDRGRVYDETYDAKTNTIYRTFRPTPAPSAPK